MGKILDYEQMNELLNSLDKNVIKKCEPIGYTNFNYPIDHYKYGHGNNHLIITAGTHGAELITNVFVVRFMEKLCNKEVFIDPEIYTIHFIPFVNPEGTVIVTKAIRTLIPRDISADQEQTYCLTYYRNSFIEGEYATKYNDMDNKLQEWMFRYAKPELLDGDLGKSIADLMEKQNLPKGVMINWSSNGRGVDLNSNIEASKYIDKIKSQEVYSKFHLNTLRRDLLGPVGCPFYETQGEIEPENKALLNFYNEINDNYNLIGSFIYHSCGNIVYYLGNIDDKNPWKEDFGEDDIKDNLFVATKYAEEAKYKIFGRDAYTTMDVKLKTLFPVSILIELGGVRATPLSQFMDFDLPGSGEDFKFVYSKIIEDNTKAIVKTLPYMLEISEKKR